MKTYDFDLVKRIIEELYKTDDPVNSAMLGMHEDWFWTAETIYEDGKWLKEFPINKDADKRYLEFEGKERSYTSIEEHREAFDTVKDTCIAGLRGSSWATPVLQVTLKSGKERTFKCYYGDSEPGKGFQFDLGVLSDPVQKAREHIDIETFEI